MHKYLQPATASSTDCCSAALRICPRNLVADILGGATSLTPSVRRATGRGNGMQGVARNISVAASTSTCWLLGQIPLRVFLSSKRKKNFKRNSAARFFLFDLQSSEGFPGHAHHGPNDRSQADWCHQTRSNCHCSTRVKPPVVKSRSCFFSPLL